MRAGTAAALLLALFLAPGGVGAGEEGKRTSPTIARESAEANLRTPAGRRYESALESSLDRWLRKSLERCVKGISREQAVSFEAFVKVGGSGDAEEVVFSLETDVTRCVEADFKDAKYPSPPEPSWWVRVEVGLK